MPKSFFIGEFEQLVLLTILQAGDNAYALPLRERLGQIGGRKVGRGALYRTLDRLKEKRYVHWEIEDDAPKRGGHPRRRFSVTEDGVAALKASRETLMELWVGLDEVLG